MLTVPSDPPGPPAITGMGEGDTLQAGERRNVTCTSLGGNPRPSLIWYRAGRLLDDSYKPVVQERSVRTINTLELLATEADDGVVLECQAASDLLHLPLTANVTLSVYCEWTPFICCEMSFATSGWRHLSHHISYPLDYFLFMQKKKITNDQS
uniref:Ig-like domain-containing protein n=1 Tax=Scylla olivacea TaxID=85551 RepID=A0A0P4WIY0_SCYOL